MLRFVRVVLYSFCNTRSHFIERIPVSPEEILLEEYVPLPVFLNCLLRYPTRLPRFFGYTQQCRLLFARHGRLFRKHNKWQNSLEIIAHPYLELCDKSLDEDIVEVKVE